MKHVSEVIALLAQLVERLDSHEVLHVELLGSRVRALFWLASDISSSGNAGEGCDRRELARDL
jgi:hypothetical protein